MNDIRIANPFHTPRMMAAPAPKPAGASQQSQPAPQAPVDIPPELLIKMPTPPGPVQKGFRRFALPVVLAASLIGVAAPIAQTIHQGMQISQQVDALEHQAQKPVLRADLVPATFPAPQMATSGDALRVSPDGKTLMVGSRYNGISLVSVADGRPLGEIAGERSGAFLADSQIVTWTTRRDDAKLELRDGGGKVLSTVATPGMNEYVSISPTGGRVAYMEGGKLHLIEAREGVLRDRTVDVAGNTGASLSSWSPDGSRVAVHHQRSYSDEGEQVWIVDVASGKVVFSHKPGESINSISFSKDGSQLALGTGRGDSRWSGYAKVIDLASGQTKWERRGFATATFAPNANRVLLSDQRGDNATLESVDGTTGVTGWTQHVRSSRIPATFSPDGGKVAVGSGANLQLLDAASGRPLWSHQENYEPKDAFTSDGSRIAMTEWIGTNRDDGKQVMSLVDAASGQVLAQQISDSQFADPVFSSDGRVLISSTSANYGSAKLSLIDVRNSPVSKAAAEAAKTEVRGLVDQMLPATLSPELRTRAHEQLDTLPVSVARALAQSGTHFAVVGAGQTAADAGLTLTVDLDRLGADAKDLRTIADRAFADADARYGPRIAELQKQLDAARDKARANNKNYPQSLGVLSSLAVDADPSLLDPDVQRTAASLWDVRQQRALDAWTTIEAASGGRLEAFTATAGAYDPAVASSTPPRPVTLEAIAQKHGANTPAETKRFAELTLALNGTRIENAQQQYLNVVKQMYPTNGIASLPVEQRPFVAKDGDIVVPSVWFEGGRALSGHDAATLKAPGGWFAGKHTVVINEAAIGKEDVLKDVGRAYDAALRERDPQFYASFSKRLQAQFWDVGRYRSDTGNAQPTPGDYFAQRFADYVGPNRAQLEKQSLSAARLVQNAIEVVPPSR